MSQTAQVSVPDQFTAAPAERERTPNGSGRRFANSRAGNGAGHHHSLRHIITHQIAGPSVFLRRLSTRRRLARIDPAAVESRALRIIGGGASSPGHP